MKGANKSRSPGTGGDLPWAGLNAELDALTARYLAAVEEVEDLTPSAEVADGIASMLVILTQAAQSAGSRLELRALIHAAVGRLVEDEVRARVDPFRPESGIETRRR